MAEPTTLEEALKGYRENRFSRKDLFGFIVDRLLASEAKVARLQEQMTLLLDKAMDAWWRQMEVEANTPQGGPLDQPGWAIPPASPEEPAVPSRSDKMKAAWARRKAAQAEGAANG